MKLAVVEWRDHYAQSGWQDLSDAQDPSKGKLVRSAGWVVFEDRHCIRLAQSQCDENDTCAHTTTILKPLVKKITRFK